MNSRVSSRCVEVECDPSKLDAFLAGRLSDADAQQLETHLSHCQHCAEQLQATAVAGSSWEVTKSLLAEDEFDSPPIGAWGISHSSVDEQQLSRSQTADVLTREIRGWLDPTDEPRSLGRFAGYEIVGIVGHGGMGIVLKGFEVSLNRFVAIKVLAPRLATNGSARKRFAREAQAAAAVRHDNVIAIHRVDDWHGLPFLVMPYVGGISLQKRLESEGALNVEQSLRVGLQIAAGLAAAHAQGLVHRDIKPANILLEHGVERVTITDFGLARAADDASLTRTGVIAGTPQYMSPEQSEAKPLDARSDLFSLGSVMYAMVTGRPPFRGDGSFEVMKRIIHEPARPIHDVEPTIPLWFEGVIAKLHSKSPDDRYQSAVEVVQLLEGCLSHVRQPGAVALPATLAQASLTPQSNRRPPYIKLIGGAFFACLVWLAGIVIVLETGKGTLKIESDSDDVPIRIVQGNQVVEKLVINKLGKTIRLTAGAYLVEIDGDFDGMKLLGDNVILQRGSQEIVKITHALAGPKSTPAEKASTVYQDNRDQELPATHALESAVAEFNDRMLAFRYKELDKVWSTVDRPENDSKTDPPIPEVQPPLTVKEVTAFANWKLEHSNNLSSRGRSCLEVICTENRLPEGWKFEGGHTTENILGSAKVLVYNISLVYRVKLPYGSEYAIETIRKRYISPVGTVHAERTSDPSEGTPLAAAISGFNNRYREADGEVQPKLTEEEVIAAILFWRMKRDAADVDNALFEEFQNIVNTRHLPVGSELEMLSHFENTAGTRTTIWSIRIRMAQRAPGKEGWTYAFGIRDQFISVQHGDAGSIRWGKPGENGLQAGVRLSPPLLAYEVGQSIELEFFYRNILGKPLHGSLPNVFTYQNLEAYDENGLPIEVVRDQDREVVPGGWMEVEFGDQPFSRKGQRIVLGQKSSLPMGPVGYRTMVVEPGQKCKLKFTVNNYTDGEKGTLQTGEVEFDVKPRDDESGT